MAGTEVKPGFSRRQKDKWTEDNYRFSGRIGEAIGNIKQYSFKPDGSKVPDGHPYVIVDIKEGLAIRWQWDMGVVTCSGCNKAEMQRRTDHIHTMIYLLPLETYEQWRKTPEAEGIRAKILLVGYTTDGKIMRLDDSIQDSKTLKPMLEGKSDLVKGLK